jgi:DNA helicase-2/ATP-dependent DNA helicase PcrA
MAKWDDNLTESQKRAACHIGTHARLLAGPGTGKTRTMTARILWLMNEHSISPSGILALTFTRAAVAELKNNIMAFQAAGEISLPRVSTLHSFALRQILRNAPLTRLPQPVRIADDYEERKIIIEELGHLIHKNVGETRELLDQLSADWQKLTDEWEARFPDSKFLGAWKEHREIYKYTLRSELVYQLKLSLQEQAGSMDLDGPPKYVMIDEYQDLNACDLALIKAMADLGSEVFCAGDDDQSIYGFRYANPEGIRRFCDEYPASKSMSLDICQRCGKQILDYALYVAKQDIRRIDKHIHPKDLAENSEVHVLRFSMQDQEAEGIARLCYWLINNRKISPDQILILLRSDQYGKFSNPIKEALVNNAVPVATISNPLEPLNRASGRKLLCLMRLAANRSDHLAWRTILDLDDSRIGSLTFSRLYEVAHQEGITFSEVIQKVKSHPSILKVTGTRVSECAAKVEALLDTVGAPGSIELEQWITELANKVIADENDRQEVLALFLRVKEISADQSLIDLLRSLNVSLGDEEQEKEKGKVAIMTMHQAKGLSADAVIIATAEDEYIPGFAKGEAVDDERRLLYVSLTRARRFLYVTFCKERSGRQQHSGRNSGSKIRTFTRFLSGGPQLPQEGNDIIASLSN